MTKPSTSARVTLTVEMNIRSSWGEQCTVAQVRDQAEREAREMLRSELKPTEFRIIGEPVVTAIMHTASKS